MADIRSPGATAPDEGNSAPERVVTSAERLRAPAAQPPIAEPAAPAQPPSAAPVKTYEDWGRDKLVIVVNEVGVGTGVRLGKRVPGATRKAGFFNAARRVGRIPLGRSMTEAQFDQALAAVESIEVKANGSQ